jgi:DNA-binding MarR family transcriptional regulator
VTALPAEDDETGLPPEPAGPVSLGALERSAGFVMHIAQLTVFENFFAVYGDRDVKLSDFTVLFAVAENPGIRQGVLADLLKIKWPNMTKLVRSLEERGLVERQVPRNDRRSVLLTVTQKGRDWIAASQETMQRADRMALAMLDDAEYAQLLALSRRIAGWPPAQD